MTNNQTTSLTMLINGYEELTEREAKTRKGKPYKLWVLICDADDGEMRVVPRAQVRGYIDNRTYTGKWVITMRGGLDDLRKMGRVAHPHEWRDYDGHYHYTDIPKKELIERGLL